MAETTPTPTQDTVRVRQEQHSSDDEKEDPKPSPTPSKVPRLFAGYRKKGKKKSEDHASSVKAELKRYIESAQICDDDDDDEAGAQPVDCMKFWNEHAQVFPRIYQVAMRVLSVPATSAPVERVFSHGGIIMRPHRARLSATNLSSLIFLKCNTGVA